MSGSRLIDQPLQFFVRSSGGASPHEIVAERTVNGFRLTCSCRAARAGCFCEHRLRLLLGDKTTFHGDGDRMSDLAALVQDHAVGRAAKELVRLRKERNLITEEIKRQERFIAELMAG